MANKRVTTQNLWQCGYDGCPHLLCTSCGASQDGCHNNQRTECCRQWYSHWGCRTWCGILSSHATVVTLPCVPAPCDINPAQLDVPAVEIRPATAAPIVDLIDLTGEQHVTTGADATPAAAPPSAAAAPSTADLWAQDMFAVSDDD